MKPSKQQIQSAAREIWNYAQSLGMEAMHVDPSMDDCSEMAAAALTDYMKSQGDVVDDVYHERNQLVASIARLFPSGITRTNIPGWDDAWHSCVYINLPTGQISYHYHDRESALFEGLPLYKKGWDGHTKKDVHSRLKALRAAGKEV